MLCDVADPERCFKKIALGVRKCDNVFQDESSYKIIEVLQRDSGVGNRIIGL